MTLVSDDAVARRAVTRAFGRCFGRWDHLRDATFFEQSVLRETVRAAERKPWRRASAIPYLSSQLELSELQIAEVLGWSENRVRSRRSHEPIEELGDSAPVTPPPLQLAARSGRLRAGLQVLTSVGLIAGVAAFVALAPGSTAPIGKEPATPGTVLPEILPRSYEPAGDKVLVTAGRVESNVWNLNIYPAENRNICMELRVQEEYGTVHCLQTFEEPVRAFVAADVLHNVTFLYGFASPEAESLILREGRAAPLHVELTPSPLRVEGGPSRFFVLSVPGQLLGLSSADEGEDLGYRVFRLRLTALDARQDRLGEQRLFLGRP